MNVLDEVVFSHADVANGDRQAEHFLHLELYGGLEVEDLGVQVVRMGHQRGELASLVEAGAQKPWDLLDEVSEARKASYFLARALTFFLSLFSLFKSSADMKSIPLALASSQCCWSPNRQTLNFWRGTCFSLTVPEKRLSFWGS